MANKPLKSIKFPNLDDTYTVPEVDDTLATTGAAADAKKVGDEISDLKADLSEFEEQMISEEGGLLNVPYVLISDHYVDKTNGSFKQYSKWSMTDYINVKKYDYLVANIASQYNAFYDSEKNFISAITISPNANFIPPENAKYLVISETDTKMTTLDLKGYDHGGTITQLSNNLSNNLKYIASDILSSIGNQQVLWQSGYIESGGISATLDPTVIVADPDYMCTVIDVLPGEKYHIMGHGGNGKRKFLTVVDSNNVVIAVSQDWVDANESPRNYTIPNNGAKIIINTKKGYFCNVYKNQNVIERLSLLECCKGLNLTATKNIVLLGDSITHGVGSSDFSATGEPINTSVHPTNRNVGVKCWASQFVSLMETEYGCTCVNNGVSQLKIEELTANLDVLLPNNTDYAIIMIGTNNRSSSASTMKNAMINLLNAVKNAGVTPLVLSPIPTDSANMGRIQAGIKAACEEKNVAFFPLYNEIQYYIYDNGITLASILNDSLHPNDTGYSIMYQLIRKLLSV